MGDIHSQPSVSHPMWAVVRPPSPETLSATLGGVAQPFEDRYATLRGLPYHQPAQRATILWCAERFVADIGETIRAIATARPDLPLCTDPTNAAAVVYHRLRFHRRAALRYMLRLALTLHTETVTDRDESLLYGIVEEYNRLVAGVGRNARDHAHPATGADLLGRIAAARGDAMRSRILAVIRDLVTYMMEDLNTFRLSGGRRSHGGGGPDKTPSPHCPTRSPRMPPVVVVAAADDPSALAAECVVCLDAPSRPRLPCGHKGMCTACTLGVQRCPLCRDPFQRVEVAWEDDASRAYVRP